MVNEKRILKINLKGPANFPRKAQRKVWTSNDLIEKNIFRDKWSVRGK